LIVDSFGVAFENAFVNFLKHFLKRDFTNKKSVFETKETVELRV